MTRILHVSDLHLGRPYLPRVGEALVELARDLAPSAVVLGGDFVQWCNVSSQWAAAAALVQRLPQPQLAVPGNHDLALFNPVRRLSRPFVSYRHYLRPDLEATLTVPGAVIVGLVTPRVWAIDLGFVSDSQLRRARQVFAEAPPGALRVVVLHHGLRHLRFAWARNAVWGCRRAIRELHAMGADLVLSGHNHFPHVEVLAGEGGAGLIWSQAGTACSRRFRNPAYRRCSVSVIDARPGEVVIGWWSCGSEGARFELEQTHRLPVAATEHQGEHPVALGDGLR